MRRLLPALAAAPLLLGACSYEYSNPAEELGTGEVTGRVVADSGSGAAGLADVSVWLKNSSAIQTTPATGRFVLLGLAPGRHTVLFQKKDGSGNVLWAGSRDVDVTWGSDGQPEGVIIGDVQIRYPVTITGTINVPTVGTFYPTALFAWDDATGTGGGFATVDLSGMTQASTFTYSFTGLGVGPHLLRFAVIGQEWDAFWGTWVPTTYLVGPIAKDVSVAQEGQTIPMSPLALTSATGTGKLRFKVVVPPNLSGTYSYTATVTNSTTGLTETCSTYSDGTRECDVAPGAYGIAVVTSPSDGTFRDPPTATGIVTDGKTTDLGTLYVVDYTTATQADNACLFNSDCATDMTCSGGQCVLDLPACFVGDFTSECAGWDLTCFQPPYTTTSCNGGRGVCTYGEGAQPYTCVPNGVGACAVPGVPFPIQTPMCSLP